jgi:hypothetical protein
MVNFGYPKEQIALLLIKQQQNPGFRLNLILGKSIGDLDLLIEAAACGG